MSKDTSEGNVPESRGGTSTLSPSDSPVLNTKTSKSLTVFYFKHLSVKQTHRYCTFLCVCVIFQQWSHGENGTLFYSMTTTRTTSWMRLALTPITTILRKKNRRHGSTMTGRSCVCPRSLTRLSSCISVSILPVFL